MKLLVVFSQILLLFVYCAESKEWTVASGTTATTVVGVGASTSTVVAASASNGVGAFIDRNSGSEWSKELLSGGLLLDSATSGDLTVATGLFPVFLSSDAGKTYTTVPNLVGTSQSANIFGSSGNNIGLVGTWVVPDKSIKSVSGVASSADGGQTWTISSAVPSSFARYGSFPSENVWYVSSGMWSDSSSVSNSNSTSHRLSSRMQVSTEGKFIHDSAERKTSAAKGKTTDGETETGWFGAVSKTTDGGKTWTQVFSSNLYSDYYYFNSISCANELQCVVVGEGQDATGAPLVLALTTSDGGVTWEQTYSASDLGLMGVKFVNDKEVWLGGIAKSGRATVGQFQYSNDGGKTFAVVQSLTNCLVMDLDFTGEGTGVAGCCSSSGSSCSVALYQ